MKQLLNPQLLRSALLMSLTLGLAPFFPEPHIAGKLRWIWGGGHGMATMDYLDLAFHGLPWLALVVLGSLHLIQKVNVLLISR